jgi:hypothetical protein
VSHHNEWGKEVACVAESPTKSPLILLRRSTSRDYCGHPASIHAEMSCGEGNREGGVRLLEAAVRIL